jgi:osmoprotectant transport system permease protein
MAVDERTTDRVDEPGEDTDLAEKLRSEVAEPSVIARYALMPVLLGLVLLALYLYISAQELDAIEQRVLNWPTIWTRLYQHLWLSAVATAGIVAVAVPLGIALTRPWARQITPVAVNIANAGQAIPSIGVLVLLFLIFRPQGFAPFQIAVAALIIYGILPVLRNTMVGLQQVDPAEIEAGRGMGMTLRQVLWRIELPLAVPVILAGIRVSLILAVGTATLAWTIGAGGLGVIIQNGISMGRVNTILLTGAVVTAVVALLVDWFAGVVEDVLRPRGL